MKVKIEVNKIMNPAFLLGTAFNIAYWHKKYEERPELCLLDQGKQE